MSGSLFQARNILKKSSLEEFEKYLQENSDKLQPKDYISLASKAFEEKDKFLIDYLSCLEKWNHDVVNIQIDNDKTPLMFICQKGNMQDLQKILSLKVRIEQIDSRGRNCLFYALQNKQYGEEILNKILKRYPNYLNKSIDHKGYTLLHAAIQSKQYPLASMLMKDNKQINAKLYEDQNTPLHLLFISIEKKKKISNEEQITKFIEKMIQNGADTQIRNKQNKTPIQYCPSSCFRNIERAIQQIKGATNKQKKCDTNSPIQNKYKGKSDIGRTTTSQYHHIMKQNIENYEHTKQKEYFTLSVNKAEDIKNICKQADQYLIEYTKKLKDKKNEEKLKRKKSKKQNKNRIIPPEQLKYYLEEEINYEIQKIEQYNKQYEHFYYQLIDKIKSQLENVLPIEVKIFGSFATELCLPQSDIDVVITPKKVDLTSWALLEKIDDILKNMKDQIANTKFIKTATVPIIKAQCTSQYNSKRIDITFQDGNHNGLQCVELIKKYIANYKELKPMIYILKKFIYCSRLFDPYLGGISSYGLILLIIAFIQDELKKRKDANKPSPMVSELLIGFLKFYGYQMDYIMKSFWIYDPMNPPEQYKRCFFLCNYTDNNNKGYFKQSEENEFQSMGMPPPSPQPKLVILDPLDSNNNVGRSTHRIKHIRMAFEVAYISIHTNGQCGQRKKCESYQRIQKVKTEGQYANNVRPCCILARMFKCTQNFMKPNPDNVN